MIKDFLLRNGLKIAVIGAGPAGSLFTISMMMESHLRGLKPLVTLFDSKDFKKGGPKGCNMCAGILGRNITGRLDVLGIDIRNVIEREIHGYKVFTRFGHVDLDVTGDLSSPGIYTVYRGSGPITGPVSRSFDQLLLEAAINQGAHFIEMRVDDVCLPAHPGGSVIVRWDDKEEEFDLVVGAFGVNSNLVRRFERLGFGYNSPVIWKTCQAEIKVDPDFILKRMENHVYIFAMGDAKINYMSFTPKQNYITVTALGRNVNREDLLRILKSPKIAGFFTSDYEMSCHCHPGLPVSAPENPFTDRIVIIGDASYCRYLKNGIESAFFTSYLAVKAILTHGFSKDAFRQTYLKKCREIFVNDNRFGRLILGFADLITKNAFLCNAYLDIIKREQAGHDKLISSIIWDISTGESSYRDIFGQLNSYGVYRKIARSLLKGLS